MRNFRIDITGSLISLKRVGHFTIEGMRALVRDGLLSTNLGVSFRTPETVR
jgi:hypothetical protein